MGVTSELTTFQFHEGPIKTKQFRTLATKLHRFNSMKVRLKPGAPPTPPPKTEFQFHEGPIKTFKRLNEKIKYNLVSIP